MVIETDMQELRKDLASKGCTRASNGERIRARRARRETQKTIEGHSAKLTEGVPVEIGTAMEPSKSNFDLGSPTKVDMVNHLPHYTNHPSGVECIQITEHMNFNLGNALKYIWRADLKNGLEDLKKAEFYIKREIAKRQVR